MLAFRSIAVASVIVSFGAAFLPGAATGCAPALAHDESIEISAGERATLAKLVEVAGSPTDLTPAAITKASELLHDVRPVLWEHWDHALEGREPTAQARRQVDRAIAAVRLASALPGIVDAEEVALGLTSTDATAFWMAGRRVVADGDGRLLRVLGPRILHAADPRLVDLLGMLVAKVSRFEGPSDTTRELGVALLRHDPPTAAVFAARFLPSSGDPRLWSEARLLLRDRRTLDASATGLRLASRGAVGDFLIETWMATARSAFASREDYRRAAADSSPPDFHCSPPESHLKWLDSTLRREGSLEPESLRWASLLSVPTIVRVGEAAVVEGHGARYEVVVAAYDEPVGGGAPLSRYDLRVKEQAGSGRVIARIVIRAGVVMEADELLVDSGSEASLIRVVVAGRRSDGAVALHVSLYAGRR